MIRLPNKYNPVFKKDLDITNANVTDNANKIGTLSSLQTTDKTNLVNAVNENSTKLTDSAKDNEYILKGNGIDPTGTTISTGIQSFFDMVAQAGGGTIKVPSGLYRLNTSLKFYPEKISLTSTRSATFQFEQTSGYCIDIQSYTAIDVKTYLTQVFTRSITKMSFKALNSNVYLFRSISDASTTWSAGWTFRDCSFIGGSSFEINSGTWSTIFDSCYFNPVNYGIRMPGGGSRYGEKITVHGCVFDGALVGISNENGNGDIRVTQTSLDYCHNAVTVTRGIVSLNDVFVESNFDDNHQFICDGYGATLRFGLLQFTDTLNGQRTYELFKVTDYTLDLMGAGIVGETFKLGASYSTTALLVKGTGQVDIRKVMEYRDSKKPVISRYANRLAFGNCDTANSVSEWDTVASTIPPTLDTANFYEGVGSLLFSRSSAGTTGSVASRLTTSCNPGQTVRMKAHIKTQGLAGSGLNLNIDCKFLNAKNVVLSNPNMKTITTDMGWTEHLMVPTAQAPAGTTSVQITIFCGSWTTAISAWVDDVVVNII